MEPNGEDIHALQEAVKRKEKELALFFKLNRSLAAGYLEHLLGLIVNLTSELIGCQICSVMILAPDKNELIVRASQSLDDEYLRKHPIKVEKSFSGLAVLERRSVQTLDVTKEERYSYRTMAQRLGLKSLLCVPMLTKGGATGVINFYRTTSKPFTEDEVRLLEAIAAQAAVAIERDELAKKAGRAQAALEERKLVEKAKGILMERRRLSEKRAFDLLRKTSMASRKTMKEVAEAVILAEKI